MNLRQTLEKTKSRVVRAAGPLGLYRLAWQLSHARPRIFMFHRFAATDTGHRLGRETFRRQLRLISQACRIVTMRELAEVLRDSPQDAARLAVITVDDGYRDFHDHAWPVLREEGVPATFFPVTGFLDHELWLWPDLVQHGLDRTPLRTVWGIDLGLEDQRAYALDVPAERQAAWQALIDAAIDLPDEEKWTFLRRLLESLGVDWPDTIPEVYAPVTWDELRAMAGAGIEIGAHTRTHCRLPRVSAAQLFDELAGAKVRLEAQLDRPVVSLCYPNGSARDYDATVMAAAEEAGYQSAVTSFFDGQIGGPYELRRHGAGPDMFQFRKCLWGVEDLARRVARG